MFGHSSLRVHEVGIRFLFPVGILKPCLIQTISKSSIMWIIMWITGEKIPNVQS